LSELSDLFQVSPRAMARRLDAMDLRKLPDHDPIHSQEAA
jgi:hypothetical protein